jgi:crotonobetainyl-CoA:carnitine CoA-transferase CaiB-like acyl-CoA transferase
MAAKTGESDTAARGQNRAELTRIVEAWMQTFANDEAVLKALEQHRVPAAPVLSIADTVAHPYFQAREMVRRVPDPILGEVTIPGFPLEFSAFPEPLSLAAPLLGEHNGEVLGEWLGLDEAKVRELTERGALHAGGR